MNREQALELREVLASARDLMGELIEEGVDGFDRPTTGPEGREPVATRSAELERRRFDAQLPLAATPNDSGTETGEGRLATPSTAARIDPAGAREAPHEWSAGATLAEVREVLGDCRRCALCDGRSTIVFGDGNPNADLLFVGEGPGEQEDLRGLPFVGRAGELLTQMIEKGLEIPRSSVYICNIVKCRPPNNRTPLPQEVSTCRPFLDGQIAAVRPKVIVTLGKPAASLLLGRDVAITRMRGTWQHYGEIPLMPTLHPAFVLRQYTPENRRNVWQDLKAALARSRES